MGIVYGAHVFMAQKPEGPFAGGAKGSMLRGVAKAYKGPTYFVTLPGSGITKHQRSRRQDRRARTTGIGDGLQLLEHPACAGTSRQGQAAA